LSTLFVVLDKDAVSVTTLIRTVKFKSPMLNDKFKRYSGSMTRCSTF